MQAYAGITVETPATLWLVIHSEFWRKSVGVEPTKDCWQPLPDLKSGRSTGNRSSSRKTSTTHQGSELYERFIHSISEPVSSGRKRRWPWLAVLLYCLRQRRLTSNLTRKVLSLPHLRLADHMMLSDAPCVPCAIEEFENLHRQFAACLDPVSEGCNFCMAVFIHQ